MQSVTYQDILEKGLTRGFEQGVATGELRGREHTLRSLIARQLSARFPATQLDDLLARCSADDLDAFVDALLSATDEAELRVWLLARLAQRADLTCAGR